MKKVFAVLIGLSLGVSPSAMAAANRPMRVVAFGDSLTAGYLVPPGQGFTSQLEQALKQRGQDVVVVNAGVSGDTTAQGLGRLDWSVPKDADAVILELGANDGLRGLDAGRMEANLDAMLTKLTARGLPVLLAGMLAPPNLGQDYATAFGAVFPRLAAKYGVLFYPFFLDGVAGDPALNNSDGIHPNAEGVAIIVERILPKVEELLAQARERAK